jgi:hypothetical protein
MIEFTVVGYVGNGIDLTHLATLKAGSVPRIGETVRLTGPQFGDEESQRWDDRGQRWGESRFMVLDVVYGADVARDGDAHEADECGIEVVVGTAGRALPIRLWCTCSHDPPARSASDPKLCDDCGNRLA